MADVLYKQIRLSAAATELNPGIESPYTDVFFIDELVEKFSQGFSLPAHRFSGMYNGELGLIFSRRKTRSTGEAGDSSANTPLQYWEWKSVDISHRGFK